MSEAKQRTLAQDVSLEGIGVHSGRPATLTFRGAPPGTGLRFRRVDLPGGPDVPATLDHVSGTELGTSLGSGETRILTVEHVLAALAARRVDNALLELSGPEPPIRDGSFADYFQAIGDAGVVEQDAPATFLEITAPLTQGQNGGASYVAVPHAGLRVSATIDFAHSAVGRQFGTFDLTEDRFDAEIARARTFGFKNDADALHARGLALGASLENTVVMDDQGVMNDALRFPDEFLRHKVGDILGDLALLGGRVRVHVIAERPSHEGNVALARQIAEARRVASRPIVDVTQIMQVLPHRYPMLLVDRIIDFEPGKRIVGIKNVTINEPFFQGHFPGRPIMPGVLIIEAMAQVGGMLLLHQVENPEDMLIYFMSVDNVKFRRPVTPGDQIVFELEIMQLRRHVGRLKGIGRVDGQVVAEAELMARIVDK